MEYKFRALVIGAKSGSEEAKLQLLERLKPLMVSAVNRCGFGHDREDLLQEAALAVLGGIQEYDEARQVPFLLYIKQKVYFHILNLSRKHRPAESLNAPSDSEEGTEYMDLLPDGSDPAQDFLAKEQSKALYEALRSLEPRQRQVIESYYFQRKTMKQIAKAMNVSTKTVQRIRRRALEILSNLLGQ